MKTTIKNILCRVVCILCFASFAHADLDMQIQPGFDSYHKHGRWLPLRVTLASADEDMTGEVTVEIRDSTTGTRQIYSTPTALFKSTRKVQYLYALLKGFRRNLQVTLTDDYGKEVLKKDTPLTAISPEDLLIVVVARSGGGLEFLADTQGQDASSRKVYVSYSTAKLLPDKWKGYDSVDMIVLGDVSADALSSRQRQALVDWVYGGGRLVVSGGAHSQGLVGTFAEELLPVRINGTRILNSISSLSLQFDEGIGERRIVVASSELTHKGRLIAAEDDGLPIIAERKAGDGKVIFLAFDYLDPAFRSWPGKREVWGNLLPTQTSSRRTVYVLPSSVAGVVRTSSYKFVWLFLLLYCLCFGPLNYLILKKFNRSKWIWITMPAIAAVFTVGSLGFTYVTKGRTAVINDFSIVDVYQDTGRARINSRFSLFFPAKSDYSIEFPAAEAVFVNRISFQDVRVRQDGDCRLVQKDGFQMEVLGTKTLSPQSFHGESCIDFNGSASINLSEEAEGAIQGEAISKLPFDLTDCYVFSDGRQAYIGDLLRDSHIPIRLERAHSGNISDLYSSRGGEKRKLVRTMKPALLRRAPGEGLIGWMDKSALKTLTGMNMGEGYKALGMALIIIHL